MSIALLEALLEAVLRIVVPALGIGAVKAKVDAWEAADLAAEAAEKAKFGE